MFLKKQIIAIVSMKAMVVICIALCACTPRSLREAQEVVAQADSLWHEGKIYGVDGGDSATLAQAYEAFRHFPLSCGEGRGEVAYHYGKLLRAKGDPVSAMQAFIAATHSRTKDYHILGRIYSNMGSICHLAGEFPLSYEMYEKSAKMFLRDKDTLSYYYALNDMAFELAEQGKKEETFILLDSIAHNCNDRNVFLRTLETKAVAFKKTKQNDSTLYYTSLLLAHDYKEPSVLLLRAQAYSFTGKNDSAVYYAKMALVNTPDLYQINNALYILTNEDNTKDIDDIRESAADRSDVQKILSNEQGKLSQAVQLLEQDLNRKPDWRWFWGVVATLLVVGLCLWLYIFRKHKQRALLSQQVEYWAIQNKEAEDQQIKRYNDRLLRIQENCDILANSDSIMDSLQWKNYDKFCECINIHFFLLADKLKATGRLNEKEIRLCVLVLIGSFTDKQMANILYYSYNSIRSTKRTLANKLGTTSANLRSFLIEKAAK